MDMLALDWKLEWPTQEGQYLFYGDYRSNIRLNVFNPQIKFCRAKLIGLNRDQVVVYCESSFLYESEFMGMFAKFDIADIINLPTFPQIEK